MKGFVATTGPAKHSKYWGATLYFGHFLSEFQIFFSLKADDRANYWGGQGQAAPPLPSSSGGPELFLHPNVLKKFALKIKCISRYETLIWVQCSLHIEMHHGKIEKSNMFT